MSDIATRWDPARSVGDWVLDGPDLASGPDIQTAVLISIFSDREADPDDIIPDGTTDPRGWWGDQGSDTKFGSKLWQLERAKKTDQTLRQAEAYAQQSLEWLIQDGVAARTTTVAAWLDTASRGAIGLTITVFKPTGEAVTVQVERAWAGTA